MAGTLSQADLVADLKATLGDAAKTFSTAADGDFKRHLAHSAEDFARVRPYVRSATLTLVAGQDVYSAPADLVRVHRIRWGDPERRSRKPWDGALWPGPAPRVTPVGAGPAREFLLDPAPTAAQIDSLGATFPYEYVAAHVIGAAATDTTVEAHDRALLLLRSQAEAMKELATRNMQKPVQLRDGVSGVPRNGTPAALYDQLMERFEALSRR